MAIMFRGVPTRAVLLELDDGRVFEAEAYEGFYIRKDTKKKSISFDFTCWKDQECGIKEGDLIRGVLKGVDCSNVATEAQFYDVIEQVNMVIGGIYGQIQSGTLSIDTLAGLLPSSKWAKSISAGGTKMPTFGQVAEELLKGKFMKVNSFELRENSLYNIEKQKDLKFLKEPLPGSGIRILAKQAINDVPLDRFTKNDIEKLQTYLKGGYQLRGGKIGYEHTVLHTHMGFIKSVFKLAFENNYIAYNPAAGVKGIKKKKKKNPEYFTIDEQLAIQEAAIALNMPYLLHMFNYGCWSGVRKAELLSLAWEDIYLDPKGDPHEHTVTVNRSKADRAARMSDPKNEDSFRTIPINQGALECLRDMMPYTQDLPEIEYEVSRPSEGGIVVESLRLVFMDFDHDDKGNLVNPKPWEVSALRTKWAKVRKLSGVEKPIRLVRHTFATNSDKLGVDPNITKYLLGHTIGQGASNVTKSYIADTEEGRKAKARQASRAQVNN